MLFQSEENDEKGKAFRSYEEVAAELRRIASILDETALTGESSVTKKQDFGHAAFPIASSRAETDYLLRVRRILAARRERDRCFGAEYFSEPAWDILLDLFEARLTGHARSVKSACHAARVPLTTALRHIDRLISGGLVERANDPGDGRRVLLSLTPASHKSMMRFFDKLG